MEQEYQVLITEDNSENHNQAKNHGFFKSHNKKSVYSANENPLFKKVRTHRCCCCISMRRGINLIGVFVLLDFLKMIIDLYRRDQAPQLGDVFIAMSAISNLFMIPAFLMFIRYWCNDNLFNRKLLTRACLLIIITQFFGMILFVVFIFYDKELRELEGNSLAIILEVVLTLLLRFFIYIYFMGITSQWVLHLQYKI